MWELDYEEGWAPKNWCFWTVLLEKAFESLLDCKIKLVDPKGKQSWKFIGRTDAESEVPILWPPDGRADSFKKTLMLGQIEGRRRRGWWDEMVGWLHWLNGQEFEQALGDGEGQGSPVCCRPLDCKESDNNKRLRATGEKGCVAYCLHVLDRPLPSALRFSHQ